MSGFEDLVRDLALPVVVAPMTGVSSLELTDAVTRAGVAGSFPVHNCASTTELDGWLSALGDRGPGCFGPVVPNLIVHRTNARRAADLRCVIEHRVPAVITSVGSPAEVVGPLHAAGIQVWSDVASLKHAHRAIAAGVDALVLLSAGAGGQTGWANPLPFIRAVRAIWDGPLILAGGVCDGASLLAAQVAGCDLGYLGTPFIATYESAASDAYRAAVVAASMDDIELTSAFTGLPTSMIRSQAPQPQPRQGGYDAAVVTESTSNTGGATFFSAGHTAVGIDRPMPAAELVGRIAGQYARAREDFRKVWL